MIHNPYRKIIEYLDKTAVCEFSEIVPAWKLNREFDFLDIDLFIQCLNFAESRNYYNFYNIIKKSEYDIYMQKMSFMTDRYNITVEEILHPSQKSVNLLFFDWIMNTFVDHEHRYILLHSLKQEYRTL